LLEMNRNIGAVLGVQLVVDALKLTPANPGFLDARDGILSALDDRRDAGLLTQAEYETTRNGIWQAFAKFGMGPDARSNGASLSGIVADFSLPSPPEPPSPPSPPSTSDIHVETMPNLSIPDAQTVGVESVLTVSESGRIKTISVSVKITHTYIGDLLVTLISPQGNRVILHSRMGGSTNNLFKVYRSDDVPSLAALIGEEAQGSWRLHIADLAGLDLGQLDRWSIDLSLEAVTQVVRNSATPGLSIPDNDPAGVSSQIQIALSGTVEGVKVGIDITHTYIGDLKVELVSPSGQRAILHQQSGGSQDNLIRTYDSLTSPALSPLMGESTQGDWVLEVRDLLGQDVGKFNQWDLELMVR
ncbi:MAG: proprotein convertase P-domain-containing protein, partial [Nitrospiria bacterium]